jgi:hypothetical protein
MDRIEKPIASRRCASPSPSSSQGGVANTPARRRRRSKHCSRSTPPRPTPRTGSPDGAQTTAASTSRARSRTRRISPAAVDVQSPTSHGSSRPSRRSASSCGWRCTRLSDQSFDTAAPNVDDVDRRHHNEPPSCASRTPITVPRAPRTATKSASSPSVLRTSSADTRAPDARGGVASTRRSPSRSSIHVAPSIDSASWRVIPASPAVAPLASACAAPQSDDSSANTAAMSTVSSVL